MRLHSFVPLLIGLLACTPEPPRTETGAPIESLVLHEVDWNPTHASLERVQAVADDGSVVAVVTRDGATVFAAGAVAFHDRNAWTSATVVPGADGSRHWIMLVSGDGRVAYLRNKSTFEDVSSRYGLDHVPVRRVTLTGGAAVAFQLDQAIAVADGSRVARYSSPPYLTLTGGGGVIAGTLADRIDVIRPWEKSATFYPLPGALATAVGSDGTLYAATKDGLYATDAVRSLSRIFRDPQARIHGLVVSGSRVWFADGDALGIIDGGRVMLAETSRMSDDARLSSSPTGDVWVLDHGALRRYQPTLPVTPDALSMPAVFARSCARCHSPGGESGVDLSTSAAWDAHKAAIMSRVVMTRSMPPYGAPSMPEADRESVKRWAEGR
jgi:hypothetical protein